MLGRCPRPSASPDQLGCVVPDLPAAISEWAAEGVGPFLTMRGITLADYRYKGRPSKPKIDVAFSQQGEMQVELIHPVNDRPSAYRDFLAAGGHGAHHHGWFWRGLDRGRRHCGRRRRTCGAAAGQVGALHFVYYEPGEGEEMIGELIEMGELSHHLFGLIRREAERWTARARRAICCSPPTGACAGPR